MTHRILFLHHAAQWGGAENSLMDLVTGLDPTKFLVWVALPDRGPLAQELEKRDVRVLITPIHRFKRTRNPLVLLSYLQSLHQVTQQLLPLIRSERIELIHSNSTTAHYYGAFLGRRARVPALWHIRDLTPPGPATRWLCSRARAIVAISDTVSQHVHRHVGKPAKTLRIYNGIDVVRFAVPGDRALLRQELGLHADHILVGMVAQLVPWKNHRLFLSAAIRTAKDWPTAHFLLAGADTYADHPGYPETLRQFCRDAGIAARVHFIGFRPEIRHVLAALDVLVHPSPAEPFGRIVGEAMAAGKPVIAARDAGPAEIIQDGINGLLFTPGDAQALASAMHQVLQDRGLAIRLGQAGQARIREHFSLATMVRAMESLYGEVLTR